MISGVFFFNARGELILGRFYKADISHVALDAFKEKVLIRKHHTTPVVMMQECSFMYRIESSVYVVTASGNNGNAMLCFEAINAIIAALRAYFNDQFDEETLRSNFTLVYELLDELIDHGYPQITSPELLQEYIKVATLEKGWKDRFKNRIKKGKNNGSGVYSGADADGASGLTSTITGAVDWRQAGKHHYKDNEVYLDVLEKIHVLMSKTGDVLQMGASGNVVMNSSLSGMPQCRIGLNDALIFQLNPNRKPMNVRPSVIDSTTMEKGNESPTNRGAYSFAAPSSGMSGGGSGGGGGGPASNAQAPIARAPPTSVIQQNGKTTYISFSDVKLHRCVKLGKFDAERSIEFVPPDGQFSLMSYSVSSINIPFVIIPTVIERGRNRVEYQLTLESKFSSQMFSSDLRIKIPVPTNTCKSQVKVTHGKCKYMPESNILIWTIKKMFGQAQCRLKGEVILTHLIKDKHWERPPITMEFEVRMFAASGIKIRYLKVIESAMNYPTTKWVRYITTAGNYQIRI